jgi:hypothetical protein
MEVGFMDAYVRLLIQTCHRYASKSEISDGVLTLSVQAQGSCHWWDVRSNSHQGRREGKQCCNEQGSRG